MAKKEERPNVCICGCGTEIGKKASFAPGHDAKVKSAIITNIKEGRKLFSGINAACKKYALEKWVGPITKSIATNAGKYAVKGKTFESDEEKTAAMNAATQNYTEQLAA